MAIKLNAIKPAGRYLTVPATALALAVSTQAMADVTIYGRAHVSVDYLDDGADYSKANLSSNSSRLGFKGSHEINPDLTAFFQIEQQINFTTGSNDGDSASFSTRDTFVGLRGNFGAIQMGRFDSPFKTARGPANLFGDQVGDMRNLTRVGNARFDERYDNTLQYTSPEYNGFSMKLAYSVYEGQAATEEDDSSNAGSLSLNYAKGPLAAALAYETVGADNSRGKRNGLRLAGSYKVMDDLKLVGFYQSTDYKSGNSALRKQLSSDTYGLGGEYMLGKNTALKAMWMTRDADDSDYGADMWVVGVEHKLDKAVRVYANYAFMDNDKHSKLAPWAQARSAKPGVAATGTEAAGLSVGLRYDF
ncbi:porin [Thiopseudomonas denitrificans]|uniref:Putative porin n=1 Tax=Thiopseudomonas denitrificans TaxID=1501432 RepID=A0A4R6TX49_9GAMM|nr:porin [Thiopseudomonas denitrificans]TDQ37856.1 putative porin [Thiopseudomonas denitrificans]